MTLLPAESNFWVSLDLGYLLQVSFMGQSPSLAEVSKPSPELSQGSTLVQVPILNRSERVIGSGHHMFTL